jgi:hypothetical protein
MCTNNLKPVKGPLVGWKVVKQDTKMSYEKPTIRSPIYESCIWKPDTVKRNSMNCTGCKDGSGRCQIPTQSCLIHCFATRKQARHYKRTNAFRQNNYKIIKLVLTCAYKGTHDGMSNVGKTAHCGRRAYWDGKFHR